MSHGAIEMNRIGQLQKAFECNSEEKRMNNNKKEVVRRTSRTLGKDAALRARKAETGWESWLRFFIKRSSAYDGLVNISKYSYIFFFLLSPIY